MSILIFVCVLMLLSMWLITTKADKTNQSHEDYFFANRNLSSILLTGTIVATQVGGGSIVGVANDAYASGWWGMVYSASQVLGLVIIATYFVESFQKMKLSTVSEIFTRYYHSTKLRKIASILSASSLFFILVAQGIATKLLLVSIGFSEIWIYATIWTIVVLYTSLGGFSIVVKTDLIQVFIIIASLLALLYCLYDIPAGHKTLTTTAWEPTSWLRIINVIVWATTYMFVEQDMIQRFVSAKSTPILRSALWGAVIALISIACLPVLIGITAHEIGLVLPDNSSSILIHTALAYSPKWIYLFVSFGILMAILSTVDSLMSAISSLLVIDQTYKSQQSPTFITTLIGITALICSLYANQIIDTLVAAYALTASALFVPVFCVIAQKPISPKAAWSAVISGIISYSTLFLIAEKWSFLALFISAFAAFVTQKTEQYQRN